MKNFVKLTGGKVANGESTQLEVVAPSGMSGKELSKWKAKNEKTICAAISENNIPVDIPLDSEDIEGDKRGRVRPASISFHKINKNTLNSNQMKNLIQNHQILISNVLFAVLMAAVAVVVFTSKLTVYFNVM